MHNSSFKWKCNDEDINWMSITVKLLEKAIKQGLIKESIVLYNRYGFLPGRGKLDDCQNEIITVYVHPNPLNKIVKIEIMNYLCAGFSYLCLSLKVFRLNKTIYSLLQILLWPVGSLQTSRRKLLRTYLKKITKNEIMSSFWHLYTVQGFHVFPPYTSFSTIPR